MRALIGCVYQISWDIRQERIRDIFSKWVFYRSMRLHDGRGRWTFYKWSHEILSERSMCPYTTNHMRSIVMFHNAVMVFPMLDRITTTETKCLGKSIESRISVMVTAVLGHDEAEHCVERRSHEMTEKS